MLPFKETKKLFYKKYQYKIVVISKFSTYFRYADIPWILSRIQIEPWLHSVLSQLQQTEDFKFRVENYYLSMYLNDEEIFNEMLHELGNNVPSKVAYYSKPLTTLQPDEVIVKSLPYGFKVHLTSTNKSYAEFIDWAEAQPVKFRLTNRCKTNLKRDRSFNKSYFYAKDEASILLAKLMIGPIIGNIEKVVK